MSLSFGPFSVGNPEGLWALLALVPLIILYFIRPRPKPLSVPSLMFFMKSSGSKRLTSFLKQFTHDWLFLIQFLLVLFLAFTFANLFTIYNHDVTASNTVVVLDVSASSQVVEGSRSRFDLSVAEAKKVLGSKNTVILAKSVPFIALKDGDYNDAVKFLNDLEPVESTSRIGEAIILAGEALSEGRVVVISDFINTEGQDPDVARAVVQSKGIVVDFINVVGERRKNVGIVQLDAGNDFSTVYVKNYEPEQRSVQLSVGNVKKQLTIDGKGVESFSFETPAGVTKLELNVNDDFGVDDVAFLSAPAGGKAKVLLVSNNASPFLKNALLASGEIDLTVSEPPVIDDGDFDVIIINNVDLAQLLPGSFEDILAKVKSGATGIVAVQSNSDKIDYKGLLPVKLSGRGDGGIVGVEQLNRFTKNVEFGRVDFVFKAEPVGDQVVIASVNDIPSMTMKSVGVGKLIYYGLPEEGEFKYSPHYPIFWTELMKFVTAQQDVRNLNFKAGETLILDKEQRIKTPSKVVNRAAFVLDEAGVYELEDRTIAVNLIDDRESEINLDRQVGTKSVDYKLQGVKEKREFPLDLWFLGLGLFLLVFEVFFIKYRGDL